MSKTQKRLDAAETAIFDALEISVEFKEDSMNNTGSYYATFPSNPELDDLQLMYNKKSTGYPKGFFLYDGMGRGLCVPKAPSMDIMPIVKALKKYLKD